MEKTKILVVDDHAVFRDGIRALLDIYDDIEIVGEAADGKEAIAKVRELAPDIVVMDIAMPEMDGLEATRQIKKKYPKVKTLVLTQYDNKEYIISTIKAGAIGYLPKKAIGSELVAAIRTLHGGEFFLRPSAVSAIVADYIQQAGPELYNGLTGREREILRLIANGYTSRAIAEKLHISLKTVLVHRAKLMKKLGLHSHTDLIKYAIRKGLVSIEA
ncbi:MAG: response regulator [Dehalococcoidales bacterium]